MNDIDIAEIAALTESVEVECKAGRGKDGRGEVPTSLWESYSAMANTHGGEIFLGVAQKDDGHFEVAGIQDLERVQKSLWDGLHNKKIVNANILQPDHVRPLRVDGKAILRIRVPRATRQQRPIYMGDNPFGGTFLRRFESDYRADAESVRRMMAERVEDDRDSELMDGFGIDDLDPESVAAYRNRFSAVKPGHVWIDLNTARFLECIGAMGKNHSQGNPALRLAGLLIFGLFETIRDRLPNYMLDYQERPEAKAERRWVDRLIPDGTWSGNVFDFFRKVYSKLTTDLKVPFQLHDGQRVDDTPVHEALREALVNTIIHADFSGRASILIVKRPDMFGFRNPGLMRIPLDVALVGGNSDCRNRRLQTMFQLVGYGDHAGSGIPKIYRNWQTEHWRRPLLYEAGESDQTLMELRMVSLFPEQIVTELDNQFGVAFRNLPELERLALVTAATEQTVNHARLREICSDHSADITKALANLVRDAFLQSDGAGRGTVYFVTGAALSRPQETYPLEPKQAQQIGAFSHLTPQSSGGTRGDSGGSHASSGGLLTTEAPDPESADELLAAKLRKRMDEFFLGGRMPKKVDRQQMRTVLQLLCDGHFVPLRVLAKVLSRAEDVLRKEHLNPMVNERILEREYPTRPNHPAQGYRTNREPLLKFGDLKE